MADNMECAIMLSFLKLQTQIETKIISGIYFKEYKV